MMAELPGVADLAAHYELPGLRLVGPVAQPGINNSVVEVEADAGRFILKVYQAHNDPATILYEHRLLVWLAGQGLPFAVPAPAPLRTGETLWAHEGRWAALFGKLAGVSPRPAAPGQVEQVGAALALLHSTLAAYPTTLRPGFSDYALLEKVHPRVPEPLRLDGRALGIEETQSLAETLAWWRGEVERLQAWIETDLGALPRQVIHGDYGLSNTLFVGNRLAAVLDFEMALPAVRALDVASGLTFAMRPWENPEPWPMAEAFCRGYGSVRRLTQAEVIALPNLMALRDVVAAIWWLGRGKAERKVMRQLERLVQTRSVQTWRVAHDGLLQSCAARWLL